MTPKLEMDGLLSLIMTKDSQQPTNDSLELFTKLVRKIITFGLFALVVPLHVPRLPDEEGLGEHEAQHGQAQPRLHHLAQQFSPVPVIFCFARKHFL